MRSRTSRAGPAARGRTPAPVKRARAEGEAGFTLIELMAVVAVMAVMTTAVVMLTRSSGRGANLKASAVAVAAHLKDARTRAMSGRRAELVLVDVHRRLLVHEGTNRVTRLGPEIGLSMVASEAERRSAEVAGVRFFPNGSSSGVTLRLQSNGEGYDVRVDWLTGRVAIQPAT